MNNHRGIFVFDMTGKAVMIKALVVTFLIFGAVFLAGCTNEPVTVEVMSTLTPIVTKTPEPTSTLTKTIEPSPTFTPTPTKDPLYTDDVSFFEARMEEGDLVWSILTIEDIINGYQSDGKVSFVEYISEAQQGIEGLPGYGRVYQTLEDIKNAGDLTDLTLVQILDKNFSELNVVALPEWPEDPIDLMPERMRNEIESKEFDIFDVNDNYVGSQYYGQYFYLHHLSVHSLAPVGALSLNLKNYYDGDDAHRVDLLLTVARTLDEDDLLRILTITVDDDGKITNICFNNKYWTEYFNGPAWAIISDQDPFSPPDYFFD